MPFDDADGLHLKPLQRTENLGGLFGDKHPQQFEDPDVVRGDRDDEPGASDVGVVTSSPLSD